MSFLCVVFVGLRMGIVMLDLEGLNRGWSDQVYMGSCYNSGEFPTKLHVISHLFNIQCCATLPFAHQSQFYMIF